MWKHFFRCSFLLLLFFSDYVYLNKRNEKKRECTSCCIHQKENAEERKSVCWIPTMQFWWVSYSCKYDVITFRKKEVVLMIIGYFSCVHIARLKALRHDDYWVKRGKERTIIFSFRYCFSPDLFSEEMLIFPLKSKKKEKKHIFNIKTSALSHASNWRSSCSYYKLSTLISVNVLFFSHQRILIITQHLASFFH